MLIQFFGEFLVEKTQGKVTSQDVTDALNEQMKFSAGHKRLGEILVEKGLITHGELEEYLEQFSKYQKKTAETV